MTNFVPLNQHFPSEGGRTREGEEKERRRFEMQQRFDMV
jgi:hypothetical protein